MSQKLIYLGLKTWNLQFCFQLHTCEKPPSHIFRLEKGNLLPCHTTVRNPHLLLLGLKTGNLQFSPPCHMTVWNFCLMYFGLKTGQLCYMGEKEQSRALEWSCKIQWQWDWLGQVCNCKDHLGQVCNCKARLGQVCNSKDRLGQVCNCKDRLGKVCNFKDHLGQLYNCKALFFSLLQTF